MTLSQIASLSKCFHLYREQSRDSCQTTLARSKQQFFERALPEKLDFGRVNHWQADSNSEKPQRGSKIQKTSPFPVIWELQGETLDKLPTHSTFMVMALHLNMTLVTQNADRSVGWGTSQFIPNWLKLTQSQWVLGTVQGYHIHGQSNSYIPRCQETINNYFRRKRCRI